MTARDCIKGNGDMTDCGLIHGTWCVETDLMLVQLDKEKTHI